MATTKFSTISSLLKLLLVLLLSTNKSSFGEQIGSCMPMLPPTWTAVHPDDIDLLQFPLNLEFLEAEFFLFGAKGYGLDVQAPGLAMGGPPPIGARKANLDNITWPIVNEFGLQEVGHVRVIMSTVDGFQRPLLDLSSKNFAKLFDDAFGYKLDPPFDPYLNSINYMLASYVIPYVGEVGYVGTNPLLRGYRSKRVLAGLLAIEGGQDAVIRKHLYDRAGEFVYPYNHTVAEFTNRISQLRNRLAACGIKDEGLFVPPELGAEQQTSSNVLSANNDSIAYDRTPMEILRIVYSTGREDVPGGFFPEGANGRIARKLRASPR